MKRTRITSFLFVSAALVSVVVLSSCGKSLTRSGAGELLDDIVEHVSSSDFSLPTSYSVESAAKGTLLYAGVQLKGSVSESVNFSFADSYYHLSVTADGKPEPALTMAYTSESWVYVDVTQASGATLYYLVEASLDGAKEEGNNKTYALTSCASLAEAQAAFLKESAVAKEAKRRDNLTLTPSGLKTLLGQLDQYQVKEEIYSTTGDYDIEASLAYQLPASSVSSSTSALTTPITYRDKVKIKNALLVTVEEGDDTKESSTTYSWNRYKPSKPDLSSYERDSVSS
jgi:hypothetical protein